MTVDHIRYRCLSEIAYSRQVWSLSGWICNDYALNDTGKYRITTGSIVSQNRVQRPTCAVNVCTRLDTNDPTPDIDLAASRIQRGPWYKR
jgi:hypothetical protein